jgi:hypothetical protein
MIKSIRLTKNGRESSSLKNTAEQIVLYLSIKPYFSEREPIIFGRFFKKESFAGTEKPLKQAFKRSVSAVFSV